MSDKIEQRRAALEEVRRMLEEQRKECLDETVSMGLNRIRADELDNALINLRALAAEPGAATQRSPVVTEYCNCYGECDCDPRPHKAVKGMDY